MAQSTGGQGGWQAGPPDQEYVNRYHRNPQDISGQEAYSRYQQVACSSRQTSWANSLAAGGQQA